MVVVFDVCHCPSAGTGTHSQNPEAYFQFLFLNSLDSLILLKSSFILKKKIIFLLDSVTLQPPGLITHPFSAPISGHFPSSFPHNENGPQGPVADTTYFFLTPTPPLAFGPGLLTSTVSSGSTSLTCHTACWVTSSGCSVHLGLNMPKLK